MLGIVIIILQVGGAALYFYTLYLAYTLSGMIAAIISAMLPGLANIYWMYDRWSVTGDFLNFYTQLNLLWVGVYIGGIVLLGMDASISQRNKDTE